MCENRRLWVHLLQVQYAFGFELFVNNTGAIPNQNVAPLAAHIITEMPIRRPQHFLVVFCKVFCHVSAMLDVTTQSARAFTAAEVLA